LLAAHGSNESILRQSEGSSGQPRPGSRLSSGHCAA
jgi:hypothetical protein